jgi:hypothetical protein
VLSLVNRLRRFLDNPVVVNSTLGILNDLQTVVSY